MGREKITLSQSKEPSSISNDLHRLNKIHKLDEPGLLHKIDTQTIVFVKQQRQGTAHTISTQLIDNTQTRAYTAIPIEKESFP